ncbi:MAG: hypothetical protein ACE5FS_14720 [Paracoccaceae bacterium]
MPDAETLIQRLSGPIEAGTRAAAEMTHIRPENIVNRLRGIDETVDQSGVPLLAFRAQLSLMDTPEEVKWWLDKRVGKDGWTQDKYKNFALTPKGMKVLGFEAGNKPVRIDEPGLSTGDIADFAGDAPAILGGTGAVVTAATLGAGFPAGAAIAGLGAAAGKTVGEIGEHYAGLNLQPGEEVAGDVALEGLAAMTGEALIGRPLAVAGRYIVAPYAKKMTPEARALAAEARAIGAKPKAVQLTKPAVVGRISGMMDLIFGNPLAKKNAEALNSEISALAREYGPARSVTEIGEGIVADIKRARGALARWSGVVTSKIDEIAEGRPVIPTARLKEQASILEMGIPRAADGNPILASRELVKYLAEIHDLPGMIPITHMQGVTNTLWDVVEDGTIVPGMTSGKARLLWKAAVEGYEDVKEDAIRIPLMAFRDKYKEAIKRFDVSFIKRITMSPKYAGQVPPEKIVSNAFKKGYVQPLRQLKRVLPPDRWKEVQGAAMDDVLGAISSRTDDPLIAVFNGKKFLDTLDSYGRDTLNEMFGPTHTERLYRLGRVTQLVTQKMSMSGGLVAANVALHPLRNLTRLIKLRVLSKIMNSDKGIQWLTEGFRAPKTRLGAASLFRLSAMTLAIAEQETKEND